MSSRDLMDTLFSEPGEHKNFSIEHLGTQNSI